MNKNEIKDNLKRIWKIMHFPTQKIGKSLKITIESPFLSNEMLNFAKSLPVDHNVRNEMDQKFGKWILRKTFEKKNSQLSCLEEKISHARWGWYYWIKKHV